MFVVNVFRKYLNLLIHERYLTYARNSVRNFIQKNQVISTDYHFPYNFGNLFYVNLIKNVIQKQTLKSGYRFSYNFENLFYVNFIKRKNIIQQQKRWYKAIINIHIRHVELCEQTINVRCIVHLQSIFLQIQLAIYDFQRVFPPRMKIQVVLKESYARHYNHKCSLTRNTHVHIHKQIVTCTHAQKLIKVSFLNSFLGYRRLERKKSHFLKLFSY